METEYDPTLAKLRDLYHLRRRRDEVWAEAVSALRSHLEETDQLEDVRELVVQEGDGQWPAHRHLWGGGMSIRNWLRSEGFAEHEVGVSNLDNVYGELIAASVLGDDATPGADELERLRQETGFEVTPESPEAPEPPSDGSAVEAAGGYGSPGSADKPAADLEGRELEVALAVEALGWREIPAEDVPTEVADSWNHREESRWFVVPGGHRRIVHDTSLPVVEEGVREAWEAFDRLVEQGIVDGISLEKHSDGSVWCELVRFGDTVAHSPGGFDSEALSRACVAAVRRAGGEGDDE